MKLYSKRHPSAWTRPAGITRGQLSSALRSFTDEELEDSVIIYKVPPRVERQGFYMGIGNMEPKKAARHITKLMSKRHPQKHLIGVKAKEVPMDVGFFYAPYIPLSIKYEAVGISAQDVCKIMAEIVVKE